MGDTAIRGMSLCAGIEGIGLGLERALPGYRTSVAVEIEAYNIAILAARQQEGALPRFGVWSDLLTFDGRPWCGHIDIVTAGYPCTPFSLAGKRKGQDDPRHLWPHVSRVLGEVRAPMVLLENVAAHLTLGFEEVGADLQNLGYVFAPGIFSAAEVGAPHRRERLFVLATLVGHHGVARLEVGRRLGRHDAAQFAPVERAGRAFPPGPADTDAWQRVLAARPDLAPAVAVADAKRLRGE